MKMIALKQVGVAMTLQWMSLHLSQPLEQPVQFMKMALWKTFLPSSPRRIVKNVVEETSHYAKQYLARKPYMQCYETNVAEIQEFFLLHILFWIHLSHETCLYWSKDPALGIPLVKSWPRTDLINWISTCTWTTTKILFHTDSQIWQALQSASFSKSCQEVLLQRLSPQTNTICFWMRQWLVSRDSFQWNNILFWSQ